MIFRQITHDDLGCASYLVGDEDAGVAAVVDPRLDIDEYLRLPPPPRGVARARPPAPPPPHPPPRAPARLGGPRGPPPPRAPRSTSTRRRAPSIRTSPSRTAGSSRSGRCACAR